MQTLFAISVLSTFCGLAMAAREGKERDTGPGASRCDARENKQGASEVPTGPLAQLCGTRALDSGFI